MYRMIKYSESITIVEKRKKQREHSFHKEKYTDKQTKGRQNREKIGGGKVDQGCS